MYTIRKSEKFSKWLSKNKDRQAIMKIMKRLGRIKSQGNFGETKQLSYNLWELKFFTGKGSRVYYTVINDEVVFLLGGGDKSCEKAQNKVIKTSQKMADQISKENKQGI